MNRRHTAALLSIGWYLLMPPAARFESTLLLTNKPFSQWDAQQSYDTAKECEAARQKEKKYIDSEMAKQRAKLPSQRQYLDDPISRILVSIEAKVGASKCIATDDPRLKVN